MNIINELKTIYQLNNGQLLDAESSAKWARDEPRNGQRLPVNHDFMGFRSKEILCRTPIVKKPFVRRKRSKKACDYPFI